MKCPSCKHPLNQYKYQGLLLDMCRNCKGMWFDPSEMKYYVEFLQQDNVEIPYARIDLERKVVTDASIQETGKLCPRCEAAMRKFNYAYDSNIILDRCPSCGGMWADRGEVVRIATYVKGNPRLNKLGVSVMEHNKEAQMFKEFVELGKDLRANAGWLYFRRFIFPLGDDMATSVFPATLLGLMTLNVIVFLCQFFLVLDPELFIEEWGMMPSDILSGERFLTLISSIFLHGNALHLAGNMFFLWIFGDNVEDAMGHLAFPAYYLLFGAAGGILHIIVNPALNVPVVGASGAVAGVMGAYFILFPHAKLRMLIINRVIDIPAYFYLAVWIGIQIFSGAVSTMHLATSRTAWFGHIGGFASGVMVAWIMRKARHAPGSTAV